MRAHTHTHTHLCDYIHSCLHLFLECTCSDMVLLDCNQCTYFWLQALQCANKHMCLYITAEQVCSTATLQLYQTGIILLSLIVFIENGLIMGVLGILLLSKKSKLHKYVHELVFGTLVSTYRA